MSASSTLEEANEIERQRLLLETSETALQIVEFAELHETDEEARVFYSHLGYHCVRFRDHGRRAHQTSSRLSRPLVNRVLRHLGSLALGADCGKFSLDQLVVRLGSLNLDWENAQKQDDDAELGFLRRGLLRLEALKEHRGEMDEALDMDAELLDKQQPDDFVKKPAKISASPGIDEPSYAVRKAAQSIFDALSDCKKCSCPSQHEFRDAKLELGTYRKPEKTADKTSPVKSIQNHLSRKPRGNGNASGELNFGMFISMEQDWHQVRIQAVKERVVGFALDGEAMPPRGGNTSKKRKKVEKLCGSIAKMKTHASPDASPTAAQSFLVLELTKSQAKSQAKNQLFEIGCKKSDFQIDKTMEPISLSRCFEERHEFFTEKVKRILSLIIGYTVLHLNGTSWLQKEWGSGDINFFHTTSCTIPLRPFLQTQLANTNPAGSTPVDDGDDDDDSLEEINSMHPCPALVALAVVLMEVYFVKPFKRLAEQHGIPLMMQPRGGVSLNDVFQVFDGDEENQQGCRSEIPMNSHLPTAIDNCLNAELWEDDADGGAALDSETLRSRIYEHVVRFLELDLHYGFSDIPLNSVDKYARNLDIASWGQVIANRGSNGPGTMASPSLLTSTRTPSPAPTSPFPGPFGSYPMGPEALRYILYSQFQAQVSSTPAQDPNSMLSSGLNREASQFFDDKIGSGSRCTPE